MHKFIGGKVYDTETATRIGCDYNNCEELYKTENKEWFLVCWRGEVGEDLFVVKSESEARDWCEQVVSNSTYFRIYDGGITKDMSEGKAKVSLIKLGGKMKRIKGGKVYDTETATMIGSKEEGLPTDSTYRLEQLYKTEKGAWFIYALGKGISYISIDNADQKDVERIVVLYESDALEWCEQFGIDADLIAAHFEITEA